MAYEIKLEDRLAQVDLLNRAGTKALIDIDGNKYEIDIVQVEAGVYSILYNGKSYNIELIEADGAKSYMVTTFAKSFRAEIIDAEAKYIHSRNKGFDMAGEKAIICPMPGKVIKIPVKAGDSVTAGQTLIVVEAMKMQSEFKATADRVVTSIHVNEGDTVNANQLLITLD